MQHCFIYLALNQRERLLFYKNSYMSFEGTPLGQGRRLDHNTFLGKNPSQHPSLSTSSSHRFVIFSSNLTIIDRSSAHQLQNLTFYLISAPFQVPPSRTLTTLQRSISARPSSIVQEVHRSLLSFHSPKSGQCTVPPSILPTFFISLLQTT